MTDPAPHVSRVRGQVAAAAASAGDLLDLLSAGLAEDDRHTTSGPPPAAVPDLDTQDDAAGDGPSREGGSR